ncbi:MAG: aldo/keto reductase [Firmicutes bacterium]|nr:aldo/keto reductase [Bacillota bacterium]
MKKNIPPIGFGTFGSDKYKPEDVSKAAMTAIKAGYRLFDCARVYGNESEIGKVFKKAFDEGLVNRDDIFVISKLWNDKHGDGEVMESCKKSLEDLNLDYVDLYLVHWPFPNYHAPGCDANARNANSRPFFTDEFMKVWRQMEQLYDMGLAKQIGMSNMTIPKFEQVLPKCRIKPFAHEMEIHPAFQQQELFEYCIRHNMKVIGYCPIGSPNRPERDKTDEDVADTRMAEILEVANNHGIHPASVCLKWAAQRGVIPIPMSCNEKNIVSNLECLAQNPLSDDEMELIKNSDKNCRLVKGHVFLWEGASDWRALWDENGKISGWND